MTNSIKAEMLKQQVPEHVSGSTVMNDIYNAHGSELDKIVATNEDVLNQLFIETATWGLSYWEEFCGLPILINQDTNIRRAKIRAHFASFGTVNKKTIEKIARDFGFTDVEIVEDYAPYIVKLIFDNSTSSDVIDINDLISTLKRICPAHIDFMYIFLFKSWKDIQDNNMTFDMLSDYQWRDYTTNFDTACSHTPILNMKVWTDGDLFSMLGFNHNFNRIDSYFQRHTHNGSDTRNISGINIPFLNDEINSTLPLAINRLKNKIGNQDIKDIIKTRWGYVGENSWKLITQFAYNTNLDLVAAIRQKGVDIPDGTPFNRLETHINNIFTGLTPQGTALPEHVKEGKTFINASGVTTGTAKLQTGIITPNTEDISINGYVDNLSIQGDANLVSENIKANVSLWDVRGNVSDAKYPDESTISPDSLEPNNKNVYYVDWKTTNRRNEVNCMSPDGTMMGGSDLRIYDYETGQPYAIYTSQMLLKILGLEDSLIASNMQITHMSNDYTFVYQDVVNKNLCYVMQFDLDSRNIILLKTYADCCLTFETSYDGSAVGFKRVIKSFNKTSTWECPIFNGEDLVALTYSNTSSPLGCLYYITRNATTNNYTLNYNFRDGSGPIFSKPMSEILPKLVNPEATCLQYEPSTAGVLVGVNDRTKLSGSGGNITYTNNAHIIQIDRQGNLVKDVDFSDGHLTSPNDPNHDFRFRDILSLERQIYIEEPGKDVTYTATFFSDRESDYTSINSIEVDKSINIIKHSNNLLQGIPNKTKPLFVRDNLQGLFFDNSYSVHMPCIARIRKMSEKYTIIK